jgi:hypothetical protein
LLLVRLRRYEPGPKLPGRFTITSKLPVATRLKLVPARDTVGATVPGLKFVPLMVIWLFAVSMATLEMVGAPAPHATAALARTKSRKGCDIRFSSRIGSNEQVD